LKFYYHFRRQPFEEKIEYPSSLDKKGHLVLTAEGLQCQWEEAERTPLGNSLAVG
ncbi:unnamed protein product, partial [Bubo scandiacus]